MNINEIKALLKQLSNENLIFHSEAQFQYELARMIAKQKPTWSVYFEKKEIGKVSGKTMSIDVLVKADDGRECGIEVKYQLVFDPMLAQMVNNKAGSVKFPDKEPGNRNESRYCFWKDVARLESFVASDKTRNGYAIFLTNDMQYLNDATTENTVDREFRIDRNRALVWGPLCWYAQNGRPVQDDDKKHPSIALKNKYDLQNKWQAWGDMGFQYFLLEVTAQ